MCLKAHWMYHHWNCFSKRLQNQTPLQTKCLYEEICSMQPSNHCQQKHLWTSISNCWDSSIFLSSICSFFRTPAKMLEGPRFLLLSVFASSSTSSYWLFLKHCPAAHPAGDLGPPPAFEMILVRFENHHFERCTHLHRSWLSYQVGCDIMSWPFCIVLCDDLCLSCWRSFSWA